MNKPFVVRPKMPDRIRDDMDIIDWQGVDLPGTAIRLIAAMAGIAGMALIPVGVAGIFFGVFWVLSRALGK